MGSSHDPRQPAYRPIPPPPRMRWAVVRVRVAHWPWRVLAGVVGSSAVCFPLAHYGLGFAARMVPAWLGAALGTYLVGLRFVRVPVKPPRVRVAETDTLEEHRDLTDAGYVYDHEARVYRLDDGWEHDPRMWGVRWRTRRG